MRPGLVGLDLAQRLICVNVAGARAILQLGEIVEDSCRRVVLRMMRRNEFCRVAGRTVREQAGLCIRDLLVVLLVAGDAGCGRGAEIMQHIGR